MVPYTWRSNLNRIDSLKAYTFTVDHRELKTSMRSVIANQHSSQVRSSPRGDSANFRAIVDKS